MKKKINRAKLAEQYFLKGYSCSQAIVLAYHDLIKLDEETCLKIASPFGGGMARLREVCGAFSGALIVYGYLKGNPTTDIKKKTKLYEDIQKMAKEFIKVNGFLRCRDLLNLHDKSSACPNKRTAQYYSHRPCQKIVGNAARILEKYIS
ncbi:MAG: C-GCAxxG-C-C family protein [Bacilli bacterium]|nr:C-GCAxxG-C-C family protein [Bacilli bacterium]